MMTLRGGLCFLAVVFGALPAACSSSDFAVAPTAVEDGAIEDTSAQGDTTVADDAAPVDPCAPDPALAKYCVELEHASSDRPEYLGPVPTALGLDGKGVLYVHLFDKDPGAKDVTAPKPVFPLRYPDATTGTEAAIATDVPHRFVGAAPAGTYWVKAGFQDAKDKRLGADEFPGDYITEPKIGATTEYPKIVLEKGKVWTEKIQIKPFRVVTVKLGATYAFAIGDAKNIPSVHGDGIVFYILYEGTWAMPTVRGVSVGGCVKLPFKNPEPPLPVETFFGTTAGAGTYNVWAGLVDYGPIAGVTPNEFPWRGTLVSRTDPTTPALIPKVTILAKEWGALTSIDVASVVGPYKETDPPAAPIDPIHCP